MNRAEVLEPLFDEIGKYTERIDAINEYLYGAQQICKDEIEEAQRRLGDETMKAHRNQRQALEDHIKTLEMMLSNTDDPGMREIIEERLKVFRKRAA